MRSKRFSLASRINSFRFAGQGIISFVQKEHNAWLHAIATIAVISLGIITRITMGEWLAILLAIGIVWVAEMFNTCIEKLMDFISPDHHPQIKFIKDVSAGAVLVAAMITLAIGLIIFIPHFFLIN